MNVDKSEGDRRRLSVPGGVRLSLEMPDSHEDRRYAGFDRKYRRLADILNRFTDDSQGTRDRNRYDLRSSREINPVLFIHVTTDVFPRTEHWEIFTYLSHLLTS